MLRDVIEQYLAQAKAESQLSKTTLRTWAPILRHYCRWQGEDARLSDFNAVNLQSYCHYLTMQGRRPRTVHSTFCALRALGRYLISVKVLTESPAAEIRLPKLDAAIRDLITDAELADLLGACDRMHDDRRAALARGVLTVFIFAGLRRSECLSLRLGDVDLARQTLYVRSGKGAKSRTAYLPKEQLAHIRAWLRVRGNAEHDYLWSLDRRRRLADMGLRHLLEEIAAIAGHKGQRNCLPHSFRHSYATRLLRAGADIETVRAALGHSALSTTAVYLHTDNQALRAAADRLILDPASAAPVQKPKTARYVVERVRNAR